MLMQPLVEPLLRSKIFYVDKFSLLISGSLAPAKTHSNTSVRTKSKPSKSEVSHHNTSKPTWLLALEIVTGTMVGVLFVTALITGYKRCDHKSSMIIPWKKSGSHKDRLAVYIGKSFTLATTPFGLLIK